MERWEEEYFDIIARTKLSKEQNIDHSYKKGYDSSRWAEITRSDGTKYYMPKETGKNNTKRKKKEYIQRYYSEKVSFVKTVLQMIKRLAVTFIVMLMLVVLLQNSENMQVIIIVAWLLISIGIILYAVYYLIRCFCEGNLRL